MGSLYIKRAFNKERLFTLLLLTIYPHAVFFSIANTIYSSFNQRETKMSWTKEREEKLKELWKKGHTASQIAGLLGDTTRNAVIGKAHRLNLQGRATSKKSPVKIIVLGIAQDGGYPQANCEKECCSLQLYVFRIKTKYKI